MRQALWFCIFFIGPASLAWAEAPWELRPWLEAKQEWVRDTDGPIAGLGEAGDFDDTHIFAPAVVRDENGQYRLWYCGSQGTVAKRVFDLGLAKSSDGRVFKKDGGNPVYSFGNGTHSVLTPSPLRAANGLPILENGKWRMWFSATWFEDPTRLHTLHDTFSPDGETWEPPSDPMMDHVYAPSVIKTGRHYQMWYTDVSGTPWIVRHAWSLDGRKWRVTREPSIVLDQQWEARNLFYPHVIRVGGVYLMWYGSYQDQQESTTALGFAASIDGMKWYKHPGNPVFQPDPDRPWESNYVTSHSVIHDAEDDSLRIWYASRKKPPFLNKYFALNTAVWKSAIPGPAASSTYPKPATSEAFGEWQQATRQRLRQGLGIPEERVPLDAEQRESIEHDGIVIEKWVFTSEPGSRIPALVYRPAESTGKAPAIVLTYGHGGSKSAWQYHYAGQLYAKMGLVCLAMDPLGEEERHSKGAMGTRAHDQFSADQRAAAANRLIMGKLVFDSMRGIDFLLEREDIDPDRIGVAGNSLGGAVAGWMAALEPRLRMALVCGWAFHDIGLRTKYWTKVPNQRMREICTWEDYLMLARPCAMRIMNGDADWVIDRDDDRSAWEGMRSAVNAVATDYGADSLDLWFEESGGHRPFFAYKDALRWVHQSLGTPLFSMEEINALPTLNSGTYCDANGIKLERLYGTDLHQRGATLPDLGIRPLSKEDLAVLAAKELGSPKFTVEGWLDQIEPEDR